MSAFLIINADDFGYAPGISRGIVHAMKHGVVTASGVLANAPGLQEQLAFRGSELRADMGVHLTLTSGRPLSAEMNDALARLGRDAFHQDKFVLVSDLLTGRITLNDIRAEWHCQIEHCLASNLSVQFLNSHEHVHMLPSLYRIVEQLAHDFSIAHIRRSTAEWPISLSAAGVIRTMLMAGLDLAGSICGLRGEFQQPELTPKMIGASASGRLNSTYLRSVLPRLKPGRVYELMCHPGYRVDGEISDPHLLRFHDWEGELSALLSVFGEDAAVTKGVRLLRYSDIESVAGRRIQGERTVG